MKLLALYPVSYRTRTTWLFFRSGPSDEHGHGGPLGLEHGSLDVSEVLAVRVERKRNVAADLDPVEVVLAEEPPIVGVTAQDTRCHGGQIRGRNLDGSDEVETSVEGRFARDRQRQPACVRVRAAVGHESGGRTPIAFDLELRLEPASSFHELADDRPRERAIARPPPVAVTAQSIDPAHDVGR